MLKQERENREVQVVDLRYVVKMEGANMDRLDRTWGAGMGVFFFLSKPVVYTFYR